METDVKNIKKSIPAPSSTPMTNAVLMFQRMEQQRELAQEMKKRAMQMYEDARVMAANCRSRIRLV
jgi:capsule polysaccharide export protein KpsE/RkpR